MAKKPETVTKEHAPLDGVRLLEHEFIRQMMKLYRADHPQTTESDDSLYERMRVKLAQAFPHLEFDSIENLPTARALTLALRGQMDQGARLLEDHYGREQLVKQGKIHGKWSKAGNDAQAMERLAELGPNHPLQLAGDIAERDRLIREYGQRLRRDHPNLKAADIKRKLATWARMSEKQIGRILKPPKT